MMYLTFLRPERGILGRFGVNLGDCEIGSVDPHFAAIDILASGFRVHRKNVLTTLCRGVEAYERDVVVFSG